MQVAVYLSDNLIEAAGVKDVAAERDGAADPYLNSGTCTVTVFGEDGQEVAGQTWPTSMPYVAGSDGVYRGTIRKDAALVLGGRYEAVVAFDAGVGLRRTWHVPLHVRKDRD